MDFIAVNRKLVDIVENYLNSNDRIGSISQKFQEMRQEKLKKMNLGNYMQTSKYQGEEFYELRFDMSKNSGIDL